MNWGNNVTDIARRARDISYDCVLSFSVDLFLVPIALITCPFMPLGMWEDGRKYKIHRRGPYFQAIQLFEDKAYLTGTIVALEETISQPFYWAGRSLSSK